MIMFAFDSFGFTSKQKTSNTFVSIVKSTPFCPQRIPLISFNFVARQTRSVDSAQNISHHQILKLREVVQSAPEEALFFYNRVPKCSSRSVLSVVSDAESKRLIKSVKSYQYCNANISVVDQVS